LVLLALGRVDTTGSSELPWSEAESRLADLIVEFGPASKTGRLQSAAYPFTRLRSDGVWQLDYDVPMDEVKPLSEHDVTGRPYRRWPHGVRPVRTRTASAPRDDAAGRSARRLARSRGL